MILLLSIKIHIMCVCSCECVWWGGCACTTEWVKGQKISSVDSHEFYLAGVWCRASFGITVFANWAFGDSKHLSSWSSSFSQATTPPLFGSGDSNLSIHIFVVSILSRESSPYLTTEYFYRPGKFSLTPFKNWKKQHQNTFYFYHWDVCLVSKFKWRLPWPIYRVTRSDPPLFLWVRNSSFQVEKFQNTCPSVP